MDFALSVEAFNSPKQMPSKNSGIDKADTEMLPLKDYYATH